MPGEHARVMPLPTVCVSEAAPARAVGQDAAARAGPPAATGPACAAFGQAQAELRALRAGRPEAAAGVPPARPQGSSEGSGMPGSAGCGAGSCRRSPSCRSTAGSVQRQMPLAVVKVSSLKNSCPSGRR